MVEEPEKFGMMGAKRGDRCTNPGQDSLFTTPCCYTNMNEEASKCPTCGAPIECFVEKEPVAVCRIADKDEEDAD